MTPSARAVLSVALLVGFYALATSVLLGLLAGDVVAAALTLRHPVLGRQAVLLVVFSVLVGIAIVRGVGVATRRMGEVPEGVSVSRADEPALWAMVDELAGRTGTRSPDELRLTSNVNAGVSEDSGLLGLSGGTRRMYVGLPLLLTLTIDQLKAVLSHELGHYSGRHTRLGAVTYRGGASLTTIAQELGPGSLLGRLFGAYATVYLRVSQAVRRRQEIEADRAMVEIAGREAAASSLRDMNAITAGWQFFLEEYVEPGWQAGFAPADLFGGFGMLVGEPIRQQELDRIRQTPPPDQRSPYDSHPSTAERLAAIERIPEPRVVADTRPAAGLLNQTSVACQAVQRTVLRDDGQRRPAVGWDELVACAADAAVARDAATLLRAAERLSARPATLGTVIDLLECGDGERLGNELYDPDPIWDVNKRRQVTASVLSHNLAGLVSCALLNNAAARWQPSWVGAPARLVTASGTDIDVNQIVTSAASAPGKVTELRDWLHTAGVRMTFRVDSHRPDERPVLLGVIADAYRGLTHPLVMLVFDSGLLLVPVSAWLAGLQHLVAQTGGQGRAKRVRRLQETPFDELAARPRTRHLPDSAITSAQLRRRVGHGWRLELHLQGSEPLVLRGSPPTSSIGTVRHALTPLLGPRLT